MSDFTLTNSEWYVMDQLWDNTPMTVMQLVSALNQSVGWAKSTTITTINRMEAKGLLRTEVIGRAKQYYPTVERQDATRQETRSFLNKVYRGSIGMMMSTMTDGKTLTRDEIDELYAILKKAEEGLK